MTVPYSIIETRQISGLGSLNIPSSVGVGGARVDLIVIDLLRPATNRFQNREWFPPRERIANLTFRRQGIVFKRDVVEFERQAYYEYADPGGQALVAIQCAYKGILETFFNLGNALALPSISVQNDIKEYTRFETPFDQLVIKCYADTAVQANLVQLDYETCGTDSGQFQFPDGLPTAPALIVPGSPINVSPPYDETNPLEPYEPSPVDAGGVPTGFVGFVTQYRGSSNCSVPPDEIIFVWEDTVVPSANQLGSPICTDSFKWSFTPDPIGFYLNGSWISPGNSLFWNGTSNFDAVNTNLVSVPAPP